jgi:hypothetical protein
MGVDFPKFKDRFLDRAARQFERRRKALKHRGGTLDAEATIAPDGEALTVRFLLAGPRPSVILEMNAKNRLSLYLRSTWNRQRGKVLVRLDDVRVVDNPVRIVETFEWTLDAAWNLDAPDGIDETVVAQILHRWEVLVVRIVETQPHD